MKTYHFKTEGVHFSCKDEAYFWFKQLKKDLKLSSQQCYKIFMLVKNNKNILSEDEFFQITGYTDVFFENTVVTYNRAFLCWYDTEKDERIINTQSTLRSKIIANVWDDKAALSLLDNLREIFFDSGMSWVMPNISQKSEYSFIMEDNLSSKEFIAWIAEYKRITGLSSKISLDFAKKVKAKKINNVFNISEKDLLNMTGTTDIEVCNIFNIKTYPMNHSITSESIDERNERLKMHIIADILEITISGKERLNVFLINHLIHSIKEENERPKIIG